MALTVIAIGGNHESTVASMSSALDALRNRDETEVIRVSHLYRTDPMGADAGEPFLNGACLIETIARPLRLLDLLQQIELDHGREREVRWGPRTLDLDIVFYGDEILGSDRLTIPHRHCWYRRFVVEPVAEICPDMIHPEMNVTIAQLAERLRVDEFPIQFSGDVDAHSLAETFRFEFPDVRFREVAEPLDLATGIGISVTADTVSLPAFWLHTNSDRTETFVRDVLAAARGRCQRESAIE